MEQRSSPRSGSDADLASPDIWQALSEIRSKYRQGQRQRSREAAACNLAKVSQAIQSRQPQRVLSAFGPPSFSDRQSPPIRLQNSMKGVNRTLLGEAIPSRDLLPPYKAWSYLVRNELAHGVGRQMYYTDDLGETIPLSDSDDNTDSDTESLDGVRHHENMHILRKAVSLFGVTPDVVEAASRMLHCHEDSIEERMQAIASAVPSQPAFVCDDQKLDVMVANFTKAFCRRCKVYNCFTHAGVHIKPNVRRPSSDQTASAEACGQSCYKVTVKQASRTMSASALSSSSGKAIHQAANSSQPAHQAAPSSPNRAATTRAMPKGPAPTMAVQGRAAPSVADLNRAAAACPVTSRPTAAPSSPPLAEPAASAAQASASGSLMTGAVWQSLHAFVKERLPGGRKRTHAGAFAEPQATADSAAHTTSGPESSQHAKSGQAQLAAQQLLTKSASQPEAPENKMGQVASRSVISPGTVDLTLTSSDSEGGTARLLSSKKKRGRRASGAGSDPIEIDFTTSEDSKSLTPSHQHSKDSASHDGTTTVHQSQERQTDAEKPLPKDGSGHQHTLSAANSDDLAPDGTTAMSARKDDGNDEAEGGADDGNDEAEASAEATAEDTIHPDEGWTAFEVSMFDKAAEIFTGESCKMARLVGTKTCQQVHARLQKVGLPAALAGAANMTPSKGGAKGLSRRPGFNKRPKMKYAGQAKHVVMKRLANAKGKQQMPPYQPCQCKGGCKEGCPCTGQGHFCEKFCACGPECESRYKGCVCKGGCSSRRCPCVAADRECDPDLCKPCQWTICSHKLTGNTDCQNMTLRMRQHKRVAMGLSHVAGWGAFAQEDIRKNEFVAEYTGELIDHCEADRRGKAYDRDSNTYLFDLNDEWVIDAKQRGNKMRFANHSDEPNCKVQIKMVDGDHRVAIYAAKDIAIGTELLYNYGDKFGAV